MKTIRLKDIADTPWKNGGGNTKELLRISKNNDIDFRISVAQVEKDGPFSNYPGFNRILVLVKGLGVDLLSHNEITTLTTLQNVYPFSGDKEIFCHLIDGPVQDFNVFFRNDRNYQLKILELIPGQKISLTEKDHYLYLVEGEMEHDENKILNETLIIYEDQMVEFVAVKSCIIFEIKKDKKKGSPK